MNTTIKKLIEVIERGDKDETLSFLGEVKQQSLEDFDLIAWMSIPNNVILLHDKLIEHLGVSKRSMLVKGRITNRQRRAYYFVQAMENGVRRAQ